MKEYNNDSDHSEIELMLVEKNDESSLISSDINNIKPISKDKLQNKEKEEGKEINNNIKDYLFFFFLMISSSMNFSYLYFVFIIFAIILNILMNKNNINYKSLKSKIVIISMIYSIILFIFKIISLSLINNNNSFIKENEDLFLDLGICYLRKSHTTFFYFMTFLSELIIIVFSFYHIMTKNNDSSDKNDISLMKINFWILIILNYIFIICFATFNTSFLTLFYVLIIQIILLLNSINLNHDKLKKLTIKGFFLLKYCILIQIGFINLFNVHRLQENIINQNYITNEDRTIKVFSIFTQIGINYAYNDELRYIFKEWIGYLSAIFSLISLTYSLNKINEYELINKKTILKETNNIEENNNDKKLKNYKRSLSKRINIKNIFEIIIKFLTSSKFIIQICRIISIFYIYLYPNFYSIGIFISLFFSSIFIDINKNKKFTLFLLAPMVTITSLFYHISNINGIFENFDIIKRRKYLNFALGKYEYSFLENFGHHCFFIFIILLIKSFYNNKYDIKIIKNDNDSLDNDIEKPLLIDIIEEKDKNLSFLNLKNLLIKFIFINIDKITLIAMYFISISSINLIHLVLVIIFLIQILFPNKIQKMYKPIICILQILFFIEYIIHILKVYFIDTFNNSKDHINFIAIYTDNIIDNNMELSIYLVLYCFYIQYQFDNFQYLKIITNNKNITLEKYVEEKFKKSPKIKNILNTLGIIISNIYFWILIGLFFFFSYYFEINIIFAIKFGYFLILTFNILKKLCNIQNETESIDENKNSDIILYNEIENNLKNNNKKINNNNILIRENENNIIKEENNENLLILLKENENDLIDNNNEKFQKENKPIKNKIYKNEFSYSFHYIFIILCSLNSFLVYLYQFRNDNFINSKFSNLSIDNFFIKNLPNIGFNIYLKDNLYFNFLPYFGSSFISVLFIDEIKRLLKNMKNKKFTRSNTIIVLNNKKEEIKKKLEDNDLSEEEIELLKSDIYEENEKILKYLSIKYFFLNLMKLFSEFYWLILFILIGIIFCFYDLSFSIIIYIIIYGIFFVLILYRRIYKLTKYINKKETFFISKIIRYKLVEKPIRNKQNKYYKNIAFKCLLLYNFILLILLYLYGIFNSFQHGCNDYFFKGCEKSNKPIFEPDGNIENYIKIFAYLFGIYIDINNENVIQVAWIHILLSILIGFDSFSQRLLNKYTLETKITKDNILNIYNENNILYDFYNNRDKNVIIKICLKILGVTSSEEKEKMKKEYKRVKEENEKKLKEEKEIKSNIIKKIIDKKEKIKDSGNKRDILVKKFIIKLKVIKKNKEDERINNSVQDKNFVKKLIDNEEVKKFLRIFYKSNNNKQTLSSTNNNSTTLFVFLKKIFEELIIVLLISIALTKLNILSFIYFIFFLYLTITKKTMLKFFILYCVLFLLLIIQSIIYITNISESTSPKTNTNLFILLKDKLNIPWYINIIDIKYAFFYGLGVNQIQISLLILEYIIILVIYIYLDIFSYSIYQDIKSKGEKEITEFKSHLQRIKLTTEQKQKILNIDENLLNQYKECLKNFDINIDREHVSKALEIKEQPSINTEMICTNKTVDYLIFKKVKNSMIKEQKIKDGDNNIPDSDFAKAFQEFIYLYLHIIFLFFIIIIAFTINGIISIFYLIICFYYLINAHKIYLGLKYGYPKKIKRLIKIVLIFDMIFQLIYQIPYISSEDDIFYRIFNTLGFSKILKYSNNSKIEFVTSNIMEIIGKPLIYLIISVQRFIYNSNDFKKYYITFLLSLEGKIQRNGVLNSYFFNNARIQEFNNSIDIRLNNEIEMKKLKNILEDWNKKFNQEENNFFEGPKIEPLKYFKEKEKNKRKENNELNEKDKNEKIKGIIPFIEEIKKNKDRKLIKPEIVKERITKILLNGKLMKFYLWFNNKSLFFKSMNYHEKLNLEIESFIGKVKTRSFIENHIFDRLKMLDFSDFDEKEVEILEEFFTKFKEGKLQNEIEKIKNEIMKKKLEKYKKNNLNNNNLINNINKKDLKKIEVEYKVKRGDIEININTIKFKQFYYLLEANIFKKYLNNAFIFKSILSKIKTFFANNFDYFIYLMMIINHMYNNSLLSIFYPISIFCYALLENPRPKKNYWQICLFYTIFILVIKFIFKLKLFSSLINQNKYSEFVKNLYTYKIGIRYFEEGFDKNFFNYIILDAILLLLFSINKNILISIGLWERREEQIENIFLANERLEKMKDLPAIEEDDQFVIFDLSGIYRSTIYKRLEKEIQNKDDNNTDEYYLMKQCFYERVKNELKYDEGNKSYFNKLFPKIRNEKPGTDQYIYLALSMAIIIIYILFFFTLMTKDTSYGLINWNTTTFSGAMVLFLILHILILIFDRIIYLNQNINNNDLKLKYFIYKKDKMFRGYLISKEEYNTIKEINRFDNKGPFHFPYSLIQTLKEKNYNIFFIQTETFNKPLLFKYILHIFTFLISHGFAFLYFPMIGNYNSLNRLFCNDDDFNECNNFNNNIFIIIFYILYLIYLYYSSVQIKLGYYDIKRKSLFKRNPNFATKISSQIFNAIPFLPQIRNVIDWTSTKTCLDLFNWIKFETIYDNIFYAYTEADENDSNPVGEIVDKKKKIGIGGLLSFILIFVLILPLILYSSLNPTNKLNNLIGAKLNVDLSFIYDNDVELNFNLFENSKAKSISNMFKNGDNDWIKYKYDKSIQTRNFNPKQIQIIKFSETSDRNWDLAEPHIIDLIELLNITNNNGIKAIRLKIQTEFERLLPADAQTIFHGSNIEIYNSKDDPQKSEGGKKVLELKNAIENCSDVFIDFKEGYSSPLRITAGIDITEIEDKNYILKKNIELGFQGCIKGKMLFINDTKLENTYLKSYFTFKSKDPNEIEYSGAEFHAFNDLISETTSGYSVITFYITFILVVGQYIGDFLASKPEEIMYSDLPHPEKIVYLCEGIKISRYSYNFKEEDKLYNILIELMRSPDYLKKLTQSSLQNFEIRKQKNIDSKEENEKDNKEKDKKDIDDENDDDYIDELKKISKKKEDSEISDENKISDNNLDKMEKKEINDIKMRKIKNFK